MLVNIEKNGAKQRTPPTFELAPPLSFIGPILGLYFLIFQDRSLRTERFFKNFPYIPPNYPIWVVRLECRVIFKQKKSPEFSPWTLLGENQIKITRLKVG